MKKQILLTSVLIFLTAINAFSQYGHSKGKLNSAFNNNWKGREVNIASSSCGSNFNAYSGIILGSLDTVSNTPFYCQDLCTNIEMGDSIVDSSSIILQTMYIANNYYPAKPNILPNENDEACAVQLAVWHLRNDVVISTISVNGTTNDSAIKARAQNIVDSSIANGFFYIPVSTITIMPSVDPDKFYIRTTDISENPVAVNGISLSITDGAELSTMNVNTDASGNSPDVSVLNPNILSIISAVGYVQIPAGTSYCGLNAVKQLLVLGKTTMGYATATISWGRLPVDIELFSASVNVRNVILSWKTASEINNSGFQMERKHLYSNDWSALGVICGSGTSSISHDYSFIDRNLTSGIYTYRLKQIDFNGSFEYHNLNGEVMIGTPANYNLSQNYPNPFNPSTSIDFDLPKEGFVTLKVYNTSGKEVASLVNETRSAGYHSVSFNASALSSGVYYYRLETNGISKTMKMALIK